MVDANAVAVCSQAMYPRAFRRHTDNDIKLFWLATKSPEVVIYITSCPTLKKTIEIVRSKSVPKKPVDKILATSSVLASAFYL